VDLAIASGGTLGVTSSTEELSSLLGATAVDGPLPPPRDAFTSVFSRTAGGVFVIGGVDSDGAAMRDALTGLANRRGIDREIAEAVAGKEPFVIILIDVDHFKHINDVYGHPQGDRVLVEIGRMVGSRARARDVAGRWGGEEFLVLVRGALPCVALAIGERYRASFAQLSIPGLGGQRVTASVGVAAFHPSEGFTADQVVAAADAALYEAKHSGRDRVVLAERTEKTSTEEVA